MNLAQFLRVLSLLEQEYEINETLVTRIQRAREYVDARLYRAEVVTSLPASAPPGCLMVTPGDPNLYIGAGMANPLRRIPTQAVPP